MLPVEAARASAQRPSTLRLARITRGLTLSDVALLTSVSASQLSRIERGLVAPPTEVLSKIRSVYSVERRGR